MVAANNLKKALPKLSIEEALIERGYQSRERETFDSNKAKRQDMNVDKPPRFAYELNGFRVLTETRDVPWRTVQRVRNGDVKWYVDFPFDVPINAIFAFIEEAAHN